MEVKDIAVKSKEEYKQTEVGLIPEDWEVKKLDNYWSIIDCKHITAQFISDGIPLASITEVQSLHVDLKYAMQTTTSFYEKLIEGGRKPVDGDLIFSRNATVGAVAQVMSWHPPFAMGQDVCLLRKRKPNYSTIYLQIVIKSFIVKKQLDDLMVGSTFKRVNIEQIRNFFIPFPSPAEQTAIATVISDTDALISRLETLIEKKRAIKQGAMQQLLKPKEGWVVRNIGELADKNKKWTFTGGPFGSNLKASDYTENGIRVIQLQNIGDGVFYSDSEVYTSLKKADDLLSCNIYSGDIILSKMGDPVARACIIPGKNDRYLMCSDGIRLALDKTEYDTYFVYVSINSPEFRTTKAQGLQERE